MDLAEIETRRLALSAVYIMACATNMSPPNATLNWLPACRHSQSVDPPPLVGGSDGRTTGGMDAALPHARARACRPAPPERGAL